LCAVRTSMPVMTHTIRRVTYRGNPAFASMLVKMLEQEGATVKWERPLEQRGLEEMAQEVIVPMVATGGATDVAAAVAKFRKHMHGREEVTVEDDDLED
jgi:imidazole glycerol phosphate synthase subunit HisF